MMRKHNLLFIYTDEQAAGTMGAYGNDAIETPTAVNRMELSDGQHAGCLCPKAVVEVNGIMDISSLPSEAARDSCRQRVFTLPELFMVIVTVGILGALDVRG